MAGTLSAIIFATLVWVTTCQECCSDCEKHVLTDIKTSLKTMSTKIGELENSLGCSEKKESDFCAVNPCQNNGTCVAKENGFSCDCPAGYSSNDCSKKIDSCAPNPCQNNGTCVDEGNGKTTCSCTEDYMGDDCSIKKPVDCSDVKDMISNRSSIYRIYPSGGEGFDVYCNMDKDGGGWTVFQRRLDGSTDFYQNWTSYEIGFGNLSAEFWLGNEKLHRLTSKRSYQLRIDLSDFKNDTAFATYSTFLIGDATSKYKLTVGGYNGTAGDSLALTGIDQSGDALYNHNGMAFSTSDNDNDKWEKGNCANEYQGSWWFNYCSSSDLNGSRYGKSSESGIYWYFWKDDGNSLKTSSMMIRAL